MFKQYIDLAEKSVRESIPFEAGVYIIYLKLYSDMHPIPIYVGSSNNLRRRAFSYIKIRKKVDRVYATRPIEKLLYYIDHNVFVISFTKTDNYINLEKSLISHNSECRIENLVNATGIGRSYIAAHSYAKEITSKVNFMKELGIMGGVASNLITKPIIYRSEDQYKVGLIVNCCTLNNSLTIYWEKDELEKVSLDSIIYDINYRWVNNFSYSLLKKIKAPSREILDSLLERE